MASWLAALLRAANNNRRTCLIGALALWHLVRWRRARELEDEERVALAVEALALAVGGLVGAGLSLVLQLLKAGTHELDLLARG